jgi:hypothetical protein
LNAQQIYIASIQLLYLDGKEAIAENTDILTVKFLCTGRITYAEPKEFPVEKK